MGKVKFNKNRRKEPNDLVNEDIRFPKVLVIDADGTQLGVLSRREALDRAFQSRWLPRPSPLSAKFSITAAIVSNSRRRKEKLRKTSM